MKKKRGSKPPEVPQPATSAEIQAAVEALTQTQLIRLQWFARFRVGLLGSRRMGMEAQDLLQEAYARTFSGERVWNKAAVDMFGHLVGTMRSLSSHMAEHLAQGEALPESALTGRDSEDDDSPMARIPSPAPSPERAVIARQQIELIEKAFEDDTVASLILLGLREGRKGPEIQDALGITSREYETVMTRIRRTVRRILPRGGDLDG